MFAKFFQFKKNLFLAILLLVVFVLPTKALAQDLLTVGSTSSVLSGTESAIFANISNSSPTSTFLLMLKSGVASKFSVDKDGNANAVGTITAGRFSGPLSGTIGAAYVSSGSFGLFTGEGDNYSFPSRLGIGTTTPATPLHIIGATTIQSGSGTGALVIGADVTLNTLTANVRKLGRITIPSFSNTYNFTMLSADSNSGSDALYFGGMSGALTPSPTLIAFSTTPTAGSTAGNAERMRISANGNVGIGTTAPDASLSVRSASQNAVVNIFGVSSTVDYGVIQVSTSGELINPSNRPLILQPNGGNVGIGITNPGAKLDVLGAIRTNNQLISTLANGTAPIVVSSATKVTNLNADLIDGFDSSDFAYADKRSYNSVVGDNGVDDWYSLFQINDASVSPVICNIKAYAHTSATFVVSKGYSGGNGMISIINANTASANGSHKYLKGVRLTSDGIVQIKLNAGAIVSISAEILSSGSSALALFTTLNRETGSPTITDSVDPLINGLIRAKGALYSSSGDSYFGGNVGIGTTTPAAGLEVVAGGNYSILAGSKRIGNVAAPVDLYDAVNRNYVDSNFIASTSLPTITNAFVQGGNSFGTKAILGTNDGKALGIETMNVERMTFLVNGYTGIGTTNPGAPLEIVGYGTDRTLTLGTDPYAAGQSGSIVFKHSYETTSGQYDSVRMNVHGSTAGYSNAADYFGIDTATGVNTWANRLAMTLNGNVGIGTTNPSNKFQIGSNSLGWSNNDAVISNSNGGIAIANNSGYSYIFGSNRLDLYGNSINTLSLYGGYVGVSTTTPNARLDIKGNLKVTDAGTIYNADSSRWLYMNSAGDSLKVNGSLYSTAGFLKTDGEGINYMMGSLGVGKNNPQTKLEVLGEIRSSALSGNNAVISMRNSTSDFTSFLTSVGDGYMSTSVGSLRISGKTSLSLEINDQAKIFIASTGKVGVGNNSPDKELDVVGYINASNGLCIGGVCKDWTTIGGTFNSSTPLTVGTLTASDIVMGGSTRNILNVNKLTVGTIDPLYRIDGTNYSSFASAIVGGVKEEYLGRVKISKLNSAKEYEYRLDFSKLSAPSDLWVWRQTVDFSPENVEVNITPYGAFASTYYIIEDEAIIFRANKPVTVSYRLAGKRLDWQAWPTKAHNQQEKPSFIINNGQAIK